MRKVLMRPSHFTFHRQSMAPRFRVQADEATPLARIELASRAQLLSPAKAAERSADNYFDSSRGAPGTAAAELRLASGKLSYEVPAPVWERLRAGTHIFYRVTATSASPPDWSGSAPRTVRSVDDANAALGYAHYVGISDDRLGEPWNFPDVEPLAQVPVYYRTKLELLTRLHETQEAAYLLRRLVGHPNYTSLSVDQRCKALLVFSATHTPARRALLQLFERNIPAVAPATTPTPAARSTDLSARRGTLLDNLAQFVELDPHLDIPDGTDVLIADVIEEVADPSFEINQGTKGTCVPTSVSWILAAHFPAEYARLTFGFLSEAASAMLANGDVARAPADAYRYDVDEQSVGTKSFLRRSWSERLFQSSMMGYARPGLSYSNLQDVFSDRREGLTMDELCRLLRGLRNLAHRAVTGTGAVLVEDIGRRLSSSGLPVLTQMRWGTSSHEVVSVQADASEVTFRNPWGGMQYRVGAPLQNPTRRSVNPSRAEEAITRANLAAAIQSIVVEG